jgi:two-component system, cell cycle sensor histidine kinase PleC
MTYKAIEERMREYSETKVPPRPAEVPSRMSLNDETAQRLLAHLSHEIRTPLNAILGYAEVMEAGYAGALSDSQRDYLRNIRQAGTGLMRELECLLDLAAIQSGQFPIEIKTCDLAGLVLESVSATRTLCSEKDIDLIIGRCEVLVRADARALTLAMTNAIGALCRTATFRSRIMIEASAAKGSVHVSIQGTGPAIPDAILRALDEGNFFACDPYRRDQDRPLGMQLDLPIAKGLVRLQDGLFRIRCLPHGGNEILMELPGHSRAAHA